MVGGDSATGPAPSSDAAARSDGPKQADAATRSDGGPSSTDAAARSDGGPKSTDAGSAEAAMGDSSSHDAAGHVPDAEAKGDAGDGPYGSNGSESVKTATFSLTSPTDSFSTTAYIPGGAGPFPVVVLSSGFQQPGSAYAPYASRLASWGIVTLLRDDPGFLSSLDASDLAADVAYVVTTWLPATNADASSALHAKVDPSKIGLAGHSRGGQVALLAAEGAAKGKVLGVFGLDPVDTASGGVEARTDLSSIDVALAFIGETTDASGGVGGMPCAPSADNYQVLYGAAASPAVSITAINADHTMFEDPSTCAFCTLCTAGTAVPSAVLGASVRYMTAFFARQLLGDASVGAAFAGAGMGEDVASGLVSVTSK